MKNSLVLLVILVVILGVGLYLYGGNSTQANDDAIKIRLLVAHQPVSVFERSNKIFADELIKQSNGTLELEVLNPSDFGYDSDIPLADVYRLMDEGKIHISTAPTSAFDTTAPRTNVFLMPFLFSNYNSLVGFLDSKDAEAILSDVTEKTRVTALAFTFSGGSRVIALRDENISSANDLEGKHIVALANSLTKAAIEALGAEVIPINSTDLSGADGTEVAYTRFSQLSAPTTMRSIVETRHSALVTALIANDLLFDSLNEEQQNALKIAAQKAAVAERADSKRLADQTKDELIASGVSVITLSNKERGVLRDENIDVYAAFESQVGTNLLELNL